MKNKKRVLFVAHVDSHIQAFHIPFLKLFKDNNYIVDVASNGNSIFKYCDHKYNLPFCRNPFSLSNIKAFKELEEILDKNKYDIIHCHTPVGGAIARLANKKSNHYSRTRIIYTAHGFHFFKGNNFLKNFIFKNIEKYFAKYTDVLITINKEDYEAAKKFKLKENGTVEYVPGVGIDIEKINSISGNRKKFLEELQISGDSILLLSVGELNNNKNHRVIIETLPKLPKNIHYLICGVGVLKDEYIELSKKLKVENRLHLLGYRNNIIEIMKSCDVFVFPSKREGLSVALMEAMACGLPCIVSNIRGNNDLIKYDYTCELNYFNDSLLHLLSNEKELYNQGQYNKAIIKKYDIRLVQKKYMKIYKRRT